MRRLGGIVAWGIFLACLPTLASAQTIGAYTAVDCAQGYHVIPGTTQCAPNSGTQSGPKPTCQLTAPGPSAGIGATVNLSWRSTNATGGSITTIGSVGPSGTQGVIPLAPATTYTGTFTGPGGTATCQISIPVSGSYVSGGSSTGGSINVGSYGATAPPPLSTPSNTTSGTNLSSGSGGTLNTSQGLVTCNGAADCNLCTFGSTFQKLLNFAVGFSIPLAAVAFAFAGWLYFSNRDNPTQVERAHKIFRTVLVGFLLVLMAWLLIQTILKVVSPNYKSWNSWQCTGNRVTDGQLSKVLGDALGNPTQAPVAVVSIPSQYQATSQGVLYDDRTGCANGSQWNQTVLGCVNSEGDVTQPIGFSGGLTNYTDPTSYSTCDGTDQIGSDGLCHGYGLGDEEQTYSPYAISTSRSGPEGTCPNGYRYTEDTTWAWCQGPDGSNDVQDFVSSSPNGQPVQCTNSGICNNIAAAAQAYYGSNTSAGPDGGNLACAWAVNNVLTSAGIQPIDGNSVANMESALQSGRGTAEDQSQAQPGDIIVFGGMSHVGICQNAGCSSVLSNSSSRATFTSVYAPTSGSRFYRVNN